LSSHNSEYAQPSEWQTVGFQRDFDKVSGVFAEPAIPELPPIHLEKAFQFRFLRQKERQGINIIELACFENS
jgi:hypothetical protein